jgi:hypothetical protein
MTSVSALPFFLLQALDDGKWCTQHALQGAAGGSSAERLEAHRRCCHMPLMSLHQPTAGWDFKGSARDTTKSGWVISDVII